MFLLSVPSPLCFLSDIVDYTIQDAACGHVWIHLGTILGDVLKHITCSPIPNLTRMPRDMSVSYENVYRFAVCYERENEIRLLGFYAMGYTTQVANLTIHNAGI